MRTFPRLRSRTSELPAASRNAWAQAYPTDTIGRVMAEGMKRSLDQPVIVENATGAGGTIAVGRVARAAPDGYTLSLGHNGSHVMMVRPMPSVMVS
jgi:tripartite-type tricarboxylate transporter receptor subunit TctC